MLKALTLMRTHSAFRLTQESHLRNSCTTSDSKTTSGSLPLLCGNSGPGVTTGDRDVSWHDSRRHSSSSSLSCSMQRSSAMRRSCSAHAISSSHSLCSSSSRRAFSAAASISLRSASLCSASLCSFSNCSASFLRLLKSSDEGDNLFFKGAGGCHGGRQDILFGHDAFSAQVT